MSTTQGSAARVLQLPELLEQILLETPMQELYVLQRVDYTFRNTITRSKALRTKMLLQPSPTTVRDLEAFLDLPRIKKVVAPFSFTFSTTRINALPYINALTSYGWLLGHERKSHDQLFTKARQLGSWQSVKLVQLDQNHVVALRLGPDRTVADALRIGPDATVGDLVAAAERIVVEAWEAGVQTRSDHVTAE